MSFSLPHFLRRAAPEALQEYFRTRGSLGFDMIDWKAKPQALLDALMTTLQALIDTDRSRVIEEFEQVSQLCGEAGQRALRFAVLDQALLADIERRVGEEARALALLLADSELVDRAVATAFAERQYGGRSWNSYLVPARAPSDDRSAREALKSDLAAIFKEFDGSGQRMTIEIFERRGRHGDDSTIIQYTLYIEGLPETKLEYEENGPHPRTSRPAIEASICCDPDKGLLDVVAKGGKGVREQIAQCFARHLLGADDAVAAVARRRFDLSRLKDRMTFATDAEDGIKHVGVQALRLGDGAGHFGRVTLETDNAEKSDIHTASASWFGAADPLRRDDWAVIQARLRIVFHPEAGKRREKTITVDLRVPNASNLKDQTRRHQILADKYLERWGLVEPA